MNRRDFLSSIGATTLVLAGAPEALIAEADEIIINTDNFILRGETFYLDRPLVIQAKNVLIDQCHFIASPEFEARSCVVLREVKTAQITNCHFDMTQARPVVVSDTRHRFYASPQEIENTQ